MKTNPAAMDHTIYDKRKYPIVGVREGYGEWARTYELCVQDEMDLRLLERVTVGWATPRAVLDLACGTGRIGVWLRQRVAAEAAIDGVDLTPEMLQAARSKNVYRDLRVADVTATGLPDAGYDLCIQSLADEHLRDLGPLYREASRVGSSEATFVIVGYHPHFLMAGMPTHFDRTPGESITIRSYVHLFSDHVKAARASGWTLTQMDEAVIDDVWLRKKPKWEKYAGLPISFVMVWRKTHGGD